jgi:hypothetical protein
MPDYLALVRGWLASMGVPIDYISSITNNLAGNDIVAVATRLALVGVLAAVLKSFISKWQNRIYEGAFIAVLPDLTNESSLPYCIHPVY